MKLDNSTPAALDLVDRTKTKMPETEEKLRQDIATAILNRRWVLPLGIAFLGLALNTIVAVKMAGTRDEPYHVGYGIAVLKGFPERDSTSFLFNSQMPISALNALPHGVGKLLRASGLAERLGEKLRGLRAARIPTVLATFGLCLLVYVYAESLYGRTAALFAEVLFILSPNIMAHGTLATVDLYSALAVVLFLYSFRVFLLKPSLKTAAYSAIALGVAQLTKFSAIYLYFVIILFALFVLLYFRFTHESLFRIKRRQLGIGAAIFILCSVAIINMGFLFNQTFTPLARYEFRSTSSKTLQQVPILRAIPLPLPYPYVQGFDIMSYANRYGNTFGNICLLGHVRGLKLARSDGFYAYYLVAYLFKEPLGMQLLLLLSLLWIVRHRRLPDFLREEWLLLLTAGTFLFVLSFFSNTQIGIRHILPVLTIFVIVSGAAFANWYQSRWRYRALLCGCLLWIAVSVGSYFPHMIPYFNELLTDRKMAYHILADSNLDWNQDHWVVEDFLKRNPDVVLDPPAPVVGRILVGGDLLAGVYPRTADYWVRVEALRPIAQVGYAHFLFYIPNSGHSQGKNIRLCSTIYGLSIGKILRMFQP
jgi:4-amino-4-deoxy-L-arabinose transferase-like glycosyltransferase